jgi:hypothetical protein
MPNEPAPPRYYEPISTNNYHQPVPAWNSGFLDSNRFATPIDPQDTSDTLRFCAVCSDRRELSDMTELTDETLVCSRCVEDGYVEACGDCGISQLSNRSSYEGVCHSCDTGSMYDYGYIGNLQFYDEYGIRNSQRKYFGVELEVDSGETINRTKRYLVTRPVSKLEYTNCITRDASLMTGFEITTNPLTLEAHTSTDYWDTVTEIAKENKWLSDGMNTCGIHVHISQTAFKDSMHKMKFVYFFNSQKTFIEQLARRRGNEYSYFKQKDNLLDCIYTDKHDVVATCLANTYEVRAFKGTLNPDTIKAYIESVDAICEFTRELNPNIILVRGITLKKFYAYIIKNKDKYKYLIKYLINRELMTEAMLIKGRPLKQCKVCGSIGHDLIKAHGTSMCADCKCRIDNVN